MDTPNQFTKRSIIAKNARAYLGNALTMRTRFGEVIVICPSLKACESAFDALTENDNDIMDIDKVQSVAICSQKDVVFTRG